MKTAATLLSLVLLVSSSLQAVAVTPAAPPLAGPPGPLPPKAGGTPPPVPRVHAPPPPPPAGPGHEKGGKFSPPLSGLSAAQIADFIVGKEEFLNEETEESGLGPIFNDVSCVACHFEGGAGGGSRTLVTRFGRVINGVFDPLIELGGPLLQRKAIAPEYREVVPREANVVAHRLTTPLFGAGLIEAIPDAAIAAYAAKVKPDGIKGRAAIVSDPVSAMSRVGRFGWKAQHATLDGFAADAYLNEMGITSRYFSNENAPNGNQALLKLADKVLDPEDALSVGAQKSDLNLAADYMRLLAPVPRLPSTALMKTGEALFGQIGCAVCHVPSLKTGSSPIGALSSQTVNLYSDLLLHDMGALGDGIVQAPAMAQEMRTAPLWGLRLRSLYLHDGRASTVHLAILAHDGEARAVRDRYAKLPPASREALAAFLNSL